VNAKPRVTVGIPVFRGEKFVATAIESLATQTSRDFKAIISVDGADEGSAAICRASELDPRFRVVLQPARLGFAGNFNWLIERLDTEFFVYLSQDDRLDPAYIETLVAHADRHPDALVVYPDLQWFGEKQSLDREPEFQGSAFDRVIAQLKNGHWRAFHGLLRAEAVKLAGPLVTGSPDGIFEDVVWFTKVMRSGTARGVPHALYLKRLHAEAVSRRQTAWPRARVRRAWLGAWSNLIEAALPAAANLDDVRRMFTLVLKRVALHAPDMAWFFDPSRLDQHERWSLVTGFLERVEQNEAIDLPPRFGMDWGGIRRWSLQTTGLEPGLT
jgi:glycosyltransferase involved in cell wall biosynthesis